MYFRSVCQIQYALLSFARLSYIAHIGNRFASASHLIITKAEKAYIWMFASDWNPKVNGSGPGGWERVFHRVDANTFI
jgi:hypothetical protein